MNGSINLPSIVTLKSQAKRLRADQAAKGTPISHSLSLEMRAHQLGFKDWNTLNAAVIHQPPACPVQVGDRVEGHYLSQPFVGAVVSASAQGQPGRFRLSLQFDEAVDVSTFDSMKVLRQRVSCTIGEDGKTDEKTSNGIPQLSLNLTEATR